ncbi:MAG: antitoxin [Candidatus Omnitrophota bacterium]
MKKIKLTQEEKKIEAALVNSEYIPVTGKALMDVAEAIAARKKDATLTLRVNKHDVDKIRRMAKKKGIPYQTYISEVIHKVAETVST